MFQIMMDDGDLQTLQTLATMRGLALVAYQRDDTMRLASEILAASKDDTTDVLSNAYAFFRKWVRFEADPEGVELVRTPAEMVEQIVGGFLAVGDCDDLATLIGATLAELDFKPVFVAIGRAPGKPYEHVFCAVEVGGRLWAIDPQEGYFKGWPPMARRMLPLAMFTEEP